MHPVSTQPEPPEPELVMDSEYDELDDEDKFGHPKPGYIIMDDDPQSQMGRAIVGRFTTLTDAKTALSTYGPYACIYRRTVDDYFYRI